jgi:hypothetical protein
MDKTIILYWAVPFKFPTEAIVHCTSVSCVYTLDGRDYVCIILVCDKTVKGNYRSGYIIQIIFLEKFLYPLRILTLKYSSFI